MCVAAVSLVGGEVDHPFETAQETGCLGQKPFKILAQRDTTDIRNVFKQDLTIAFDGVQRVAKVVEQALLEGSQVLTIAGICSSSVKESFNEAQQCLGGNENSIYVRDKCR